MSEHDPTVLRTQADELRLYGLLAHWPEILASPEHLHSVTQWLGWEAAERARRSLERRLREARLGRFKPLADFDWSWPTLCDRAALEDLMALDFLKDASNVVLVGPNGVGKTMCACNLAFQAVLAGHTALFITAGALLGELATLDSDSALRRRLAHYTAPDLLFELISRRYQRNSTRHHQPRLRRMGRGLPRRRLCRLARRPPHAPRRGPAHRGPLLQTEGGRGARGPQVLRAG